MILNPFPPPGALVQEALNVLAVVRSGDAELIAELGDLQALPRPWDPDTCTEPVLLGQQLWAWCEQVVTWINHEYMWRPAGMIPSCWPAHPHLARELPPLACQYLAAQDALDPAPLEEWHRYTLPCFLDRAGGRLGESSCRDGRHIDWPAASRYAAHTSPEALTWRQQQISGTIPGRPAGRRG